MEEVERDFWELLIVRGLNSIILDKNQEHLSNMICHQHKDILEERLAFVDVSIQMKIIESILNKEPAVLKEPFWVGYVEQALDMFVGESDKYVYENGAWFVLLNRIKDLYSKVDWFDILVKLSLATAEVGVRAPGFSTVLNWMIMADKKHLLNLLHRTETKQYPADLKIELYKKLVEFGMLDVKIARRIRSDSSGALSHKVLQFLFSSRILYTDDDFQNLITQFSDTKHKWVARFMALNMPLHLAPFLMGVDDKLAINILENRMNAAEDD